MQRVVSINHGSHQKKNKNEKCKRNMKLIMMAFHYTLAVRRRTSLGF